MTRMQVSVGTVPAWLPYITNPPPLVYSECLGCCSECPKHGHCIETPQSPPISFLEFLTIRVTPGLVRLGQPNIYWAPVHIQTYVRKIMLDNQQKQGQG